MIMAGTVHASHTLEGHPGHTGRSASALSLTSSSTHKLDVNLATDNHVQTIKMLVGDQNWSEAKIASRCLVTRG